MSIHVPTQQAARNHTMNGNGSKQLLHVDLNTPPPAVDDRQSEATSVTVQQRSPWRTAAPANPQHDQPTVQRRAPHLAGGGLPSLPIDVEEIEDEVVVLPSSIGFPQVRNRPTRSRTVVIDEEPEGQLRGSGTALLPMSCAKRQRIPSNRDIIDCESSSEDNRMKKRKKTTSSDPKPEKVMPREPVFSCPICMDTLVDASSTICGHIFCQKCIKDAIRITKKCPTCRRRLTMKSFHRVYLPSSS